MLLVDGIERWFELLDDIDDETDELPTRRDRRYAVLALTPEQIENLHEVHRDFQRYVGPHYDAAGPNELRPQNQWHLFYNKHYEYCRSMRLEDNEVVAWFVGAPPRRTGA